MSNLFHEILFKPLFNALIFFYQYASFYDLGIAIILLTIVIRLILFPLFYKGAKDQALLQKLAPKIREIQEKHKQDKEKQGRAMLDLYKEHKVNPFSGFLLLLIQLPILFALYKVFLNGFSMEALNNLYSFIPAPEHFNHLFLGIIDLSKRNLIIVLAAAIVQYLLGKLSMAKTNKSVKNLSSAERMTQQMSRQMVYLGPILTILFLYFFNLPSAIGIYWFTTSCFSVVQQIMINKKINK
ncbi:membrane protein insertase YidC [Candidatus Wolfebacteria bacterium]|nr:membrane protein insertase YidC [Candidatus Wolfebacteria bacterium]